MRAGLAWPQRMDVVAAAVRDDFYFSLWTTPKGVPRWNTFSLAKEKVSKRNLADARGYRETRRVIFYFFLWTTPKKEVARKKELVGTRGFEPPTPCTPCKCATRLRHVPTGSMRARIIPQLAGRSSLKKGGQGGALARPPRTRVSAAGSSEFPRARFAAGGRSAATGRRPPGLPRPASDCERRQW